MLWTLFVPLYMMERPELLVKLSVSFPSDVWKAAFPAELGLGFLLELGRKTMLV